MGEVGCTMIKKEFLSCLSNMGVKRDSIFVSLAKEDKAYAVKLLKAMDKLDLNYWCMFTKDGGQTVHTGETYTDVIREEISKCCVFVLLFSENTNNPDSGVITELDELQKALENRKNSISFIRINVGDLEDRDIVFEIKERFRKIMKPTIIHEGISKATTEEEYLCLANDEIKRAYDLSVMKNVESRFKELEDSQKFSSLLCRCSSSKDKCYSRTISEDIKASSEISSERLREAHILSNELLEYDCNTYSCMVIATNLLGNEKIVNGRKTYTPEKDGVKYFYYYPQNDIEELERPFEKIKSFVRKDEDSRREVVRMIVRDFCARNNTEIYLNEFNGMTINNLKEQYYIVTGTDTRAFEELFESEEVQGYFAYSPGEDIFSVPEEVFAWLRGDDEKFPYHQMISVVAEFIKFLGQFVAMLESARDINDVAFEALNIRYLDLRRLMDLEDWQNRKKVLTNSESRKLVNYLLNHSSGDAKSKEKNFPRLANWMSFDIDGNGDNIIDEETIQKAFDNLVAVPIEDDEKLKLCYSFILFVSDTGLSGAWYTTGENDTANYDKNVVYTYDIDRHTEECNLLLDAFSYMFSINKEAEKILKERKSVLLNKKSSARKEKV